MVKIVKPSENRFIKALIFGPAGQGKTTLMGSAALDERTAPMLVIDFEGGSGSLAGLDVDIAPVQSWEDFNEVYNNLANGDTVDGVDYSQYKSVAIDSITEIHIFALLDILREKGPTRRDPDALEIQDYGKASTQLRRLLRAFRDLPLHVFFSALAKDTEIKGLGRVTMPSLSGQMAEEVPGLMDVVGYLAQAEDDNGEVERLLLLQNYPKYRTKVRLPWGAPRVDEIVQPTVTSMLDELGFGDKGIKGVERSTAGELGKKKDDVSPQKDEGRDDPSPEVPSAPETPSEAAETGDDEDPQVEGNAQDPHLDEAREEWEQVGQSLKEIRAFGEKYNINLEGARNRTAAREAIEQALGV